MVMASTYYVMDVNIIISEPAVKIIINVQHSPVTLSAGPLLSDIVS